MAEKTKLPAAVIRQLRAARGMLRNYVCIQAALLIVCWLLIVFWLGALLDYLPVQAGSNETPRWVRVGLLAAMVIGSLWIVVRWAMPRLLARIEDRSLALLIERHYPQLNNELVTAVELSRRTLKPDLDASVENAAAHETMLNRVYSSVSNKMDRVALSELFNWQPVWATATAAVFGLLITGITAIGMSDWLSLWSQRLFGLSDQPWPRVAELRADGVLIQFPVFTGQLSAQRAMLAFDEGVARIPSGAAVMLQISANANSKQVPEVCTMFYRSADGSRGRANLRRVGSPRDGWQQFMLDGPPLDGIAQPIEMDVVGLDARLRDLQLQVVEPCIVTSMQLDCIYPKYLQDTLSSRPAREVLEYRAGVRIPEGTVVTLNGTSSSELSKVEYVIRKTNAGAESESTDESGVRSDVAIASVIPDGNHFAIPLEDLRQSQVIELRLIDQYGLSSDQILRYVLTTLEDLSPEVEARLAGIGTAVTPNALLPILASVSDDFGIADVYVEIALDEQPSRVLPLQPAGDGTIDADIDLEKFAAEGSAIAPGMTLGMVVSATDYFDLDEQRHVGSGQSQQLAVVSADQLLVILDRQELELRQRLELIISELQQVDEVLRQLSADLKSSASAARWSPAVLQFVSAAAQEGEQTNPSADEAQQSIADAQAQLRRMAVLRAQQIILQSDKSEQELLGIANRVDNIRLQLLNNRIDSYDRQNRLANKVHAPLIQLLGSEYQDFSSGLDELQTATMSGGGFEQTEASLTELSRVLDALEAIKSNMLDIESFNEIVDLVRSLLEDQEGILSETEKQQKARILDLLKGN